MKMTHDEAAATAHRYLEDALELLQKSAEIMRGPDIDASPEAMQTEIGLSKAIDALSGNGFKAPRIR